MGQYLAIGIATNYKASKREVEAISIEKIIEKMTAEIGFDVNLYELEKCRPIWFFVNFGEKYLVRQF